MRLKKSVVAWVLAFVLIAVNMPANPENVQAADVGTAISGLEIGEKVTVSAGDTVSNLNYNNFYYKVSEDSSFIYETSEGLPYSGITFKNYEELGDDFLAAAADLNYKNYTQYDVKRVDDQMLPPGTTAEDVTWRCYDVYPVAASEKSVSPVSNPAAGNYSGTQSITLSASEGADIFYTTDGSDPNIKSTQYTDSIAISESTTIKAAAYETGKMRSDIVTLTYNIGSVDSISVVPDTVTVKRGEAKQLSATVTASPDNAVFKEVDWSVSGNQSDTTTISTEGLLTIGLDETASNIVVTAASNVDTSKTAAVNVTVEPVVMISNDSTWTNLSTLINSGSNFANILDLDIYNSSVLPGYFLEAVKGKDITVNFDMGNEVVWELNGNDISSANLSHIDLGASLGGSNISADLINSIESKTDVIQASLSHNGEFGFTMYMRYQVQAGYEGLYANLMYYNPNTNALEYQTAVKVGPGGSLRIPFSHASEYAIVISDKDLKPETPNTPNTSDTSDTSDTPETSNTPATPETSVTSVTPDIVEPTVTESEKQSPKTGDTTPVIWLFAAALVSAGGFLGVRQKRKSR